MLLNISSKKFEERYRADKCYFISVRLVKVFGIWATRTTFMLKDWIKDTFTAHSLLLPNRVLVSYLD